MPTVREVPAGSCRSVGEVLAATARLNPDREAYVEPSAGGRPRRAMSFAQWDRRADAAAAWLEGHGVGRGHVLALVLPSSIDYAVAYAGALRLGAVTSGLNPRLGPVETRSIIERTRPALGVVDPECGADVAAVTGWVQAAGGHVAERAELAAAADGDPAPVRLPELGLDDPAAVVWTSGTTGVPKGAVFAHRALEAVAGGTDVLSHPGDRRLSPLPFAHVGYMTRVWDELAHAVTTVITPTPWQAAEALAVIEAEQITVAQGVPTQWALMAARPEFDRFDHCALRIAATGAAPMPAGQVADLRRRLGVPVVVRYTSTETSLGTGTVPEDADDVVATTVGRPVPGVELALVTDVGRPAGPAEIGRVRLRSAAAMAGYWLDAGQRPPAAPGDGSDDGGCRRLVDSEATEAALDGEGWVTTGDFGWLDEAGNLHLSGRTNERYLRGGYNVYPAEAEAVLAAHPAVARAVVVGTPADVLGEVGVAFVELQPGWAGRPPDPDSLRGHCGARLTDYKVPDAVVLLDALPVTPMLKVDRRALAAPAAEAAAAAAARRSPRRAAAHDHPTDDRKEKP